MAIKRTPITSPLPSAQRNGKSTPAASVKAALPGLATPQATFPPEALIAEKAYEIWLAQGRESGCDQKHWFEAKLQLQHI